MRKLRQLSTRSFVKTASLAMISALIGWSVNCAIGSDWPHWRGLSRNDVVAEDSGWERKAWPPREAWRRDVGEGASSPLVVGSRVFVMGWREQQDFVTCLDAASGDEVWKMSYRCPRYGRRATGDEGLYSGPSSTPEFDAETGWLFTLSTDGDLQCWDTKQNGRRVRGFNLYERYGAVRRPRVGRSGQRDYGYTSSPLVLGEALIVEVGADAGTLIAFDKRSGRELWKSAANDPAGHNGGPIPITVEGVPCVAVHHFNGLLVARTDRGHEGQTVATWPWQTDFANNIATSTVQDNFVVLTSSYNQHKIAKLRITLAGATKVWERELASKVCSPVIHRGHVYWAWQTVHCLDFETGQPKWQGGRLGDPGSCVVTSDDRLIVWANQGDLRLIETATRSPSEYRQLAALDRVFHSDAWPHVVLSGGRLFCKDRDGHLACFDLTKNVQEKIVAKAANKPMSSTPAPSPKDNVPSSVSRLIGAWPGERSSVAFAWRRGWGERLIGLDGAATNWKFQSDKSPLSTDGWLDLTNSAARVVGADETLLQAFHSGREFSLEIVFAPQDARQTGPARIVSFSTDAYHRNFTLGQEKDSLILRLRTPRTGESGQQPEVTLCPIQPQKSQHVVVSYRDGQLLCVHNGRLVKETDAVQGDFRNWTAQHLLLGDEWNGERRWQGRIERLAIFRRFIGLDEAKLRHDASHTESK